LEASLHRFGGDVFGGVCRGEVGSNRKHRIFGMKKLMLEIEFNPFHEEQVLPGIIPEFVGDNC
jgi:hypothetical protein